MHFSVPQCSLPTAQQVWSRSGWRLSWLTSSAHKTELGTGFLTVGEEVHVDLHVDGLMLPPLA